MKIQRKLLILLFVSLIFLEMLVGLELEETSKGQSSLSKRKKKGGTVIAKSGNAKSGDATAKGGNAKSGDATSGNVKVGG